MSVKKFVGQREVWWWCWEVWILFSRL